MPEFVEHRIFGIDPGSRICGFALLTSKMVIPRSAKDFVVKECGVLRADIKLSFVERIGALHDSMYHLVRELSPTMCIIEDTFFGTNARSVIKLGQAKGALISAITRCQLEVKEITPAQVKKTIVGRGAADKEEISRAIEVLMGFKREKLPHDATDAIAIALTYGLSLATRSLYGGKGLSRFDRTMF
jgi:crossover junction endodeoxyribonuclease RuvC